MATKKAESADDLLDLDAEQLLEDSIDGLYAIVVGWSPGKSRRVSILSLKANAETVSLDASDKHSPWVAKLPAPTNGRYRIKWALAPEVAVSSMIIGVVNLQTGAKMIVDKTSDLGRYQIWENNTGVVVNAP